MINKKMFLLILIVPVLLSAYTPGETSYDFLNIYTDAVGGGCGNTVMFASFRTLPANLPEYSMKGTIYDLMWIDGVNIGGFGGYYRMDYGYVGSYIDYFNFGNFNRTDENGNVIGSFYAGNIVLSLLYAKNMWQYINMGLKLKGVYTTIDNVHSWGVLIDLSLYGEWSRLKYNATIFNVGKVLSPYSYTIFDTVIAVDTTSMFDTVWIDTSFFYVDTTYVYDTTYTVDRRNEKSDMPIAPVIGGGVAFRVPDFEFDVVLEGYYDMGGVWYLRGGIKKELNKYITFKGGIDGKTRRFLQTGESGDFLLGITGGIDIFYKEFEVSIAYNDMGVLGSSYMFDFSYYVNRKENKKIGKEEEIEVDTVVVEMEEDTLKMIKEDTLVDTLSNIYEDTTVISSDTVQISDTLKNVEDSEKSHDIEKNEESDKINEMKGGDMGYDESVEKKEDINEGEKGEKTD